MWEYGGYSGDGAVKPLLGSVGGGVAAVCGNARPVFNELKVVLTQGEATIIAVNDTGMYLPNVHHWISLHYEKLGLWRAVRKADSSLGQSFKTHSIRDWGGVDFSWIGLNPHLSLSGYFAAQIAYLMGFDRIILCGCPGDATPRFFDSDAGRPDGYVYQEKNIMVQLEKEMKRVPEMKSRIRSMSGFTREFFGGP